MPILVGNKCILRPLARGDMAQFLKWRQDHQLRSAVLGFSFPITAEMESAWFEQTLNEQSKRTAFFAIDIISPSPIQRDADAETRKSVGFCRLVDIDWISRHAELGIMIGEVGHHGHGLGTEATALLCQYAFDDLNMNRLCLRVRDDNQAAIRLYSRLGFRREGCLRQHAYVNGQYRDVLLMGLLRGEKAPLDSFLKS